MWGVRYMGNLGTFPSSFLGNLKCSKKIKSYLKISNSNKRSKNNNAFKRATFAWFKKMHSEEIQKVNDKLGKNTYIKNTGILSFCRGNY